ncbi:MAG: guanylate kinase [Lachnospiraceae bacterium]
MAENRGKLIVISGFSGAGKGTVVKRLIDKYPYSLSVSATTRAPRPGEEDGREYHFKSVEEFQNLIDYNGFIEWTMYVENYYGTPRKFVEQEMAAGHDVILEIEVEGALNIRKQYEDAILIFITTPSADALRQRLTGRGSESEEVIEKRIRRAVEETEQIHNYDYILINDDLEQCVEEVHAVVTTAKNRYQEKKTFVETITRELKEL